MSGPNDLVVASSRDGHSPAFVVANLFGPRQAVRGFRWLQTLYKGTWVQYKL